jgi:hypothetical protein
MGKQNMTKRKKGSLISQGASEIATEIATEDWMLQEEGGFVSLDEIIDQRSVDPSIHSYTLHDHLSQPFTCI